MTYAEVIKKFLEKVLVIFNLNPKRREPGDGSDGYCDCIGLIIGAVRRMGLKWTGIHGSNWCARKEMTDLQEIKSQADLQLGDVVLKAVPQGHKNWALPSRYRKGGKYYTGDLNDYYHAGVVYSLEPFQIRHMSSKMTIDKTYKTYYPWTHHGKLTMLVKAGGGITPTPTPDPDVPTTGTFAIVVAESGSTVNMRRTPSLRGALICRVPLGTKVEVVAPGEEWCTIQYNGKTGYMMAKFLDIISDGKGKY